MTDRTIFIEPLTREAFRPFGQVIFYDCMIGPTHAAALALVATLALGGCDANTADTPGTIHTDVWLSPKNIGASDVLVWAEGTLVDADPKDPHLRGVEIANHVTITCGLGVTWAVKKGSCRMLKAVIHTASHALEVSEIDFDIGSISVG